jgi:hypothetical protein
MRSKILLSLLLILGLAGASSLRGEPLTTVFASRLSGIKATGATGMQIVNLDEAMPATVVADLYRQGGEVAVPINLPPIGPLSSYNIYMPTESKLLSGLYSAIVRGDRRLALLLRTEWQASGGASMYNGPDAANDVTLPLVLKDSYGHSSVVTVQNADRIVERTAHLSFTRLGELGPRLMLDVRLPRGQGRTLDLAKDSQLASLPAGFVGTMAVHAEGPIAVQSFIDGTTSEKAVYGFVGLPDDTAAETAYLPLFVSGNPGSGNTLLAIANVSDRPVGTTVTVRGMSGSCQGKTYTARTGSIAPGSNILVYRWPAKLGAPMAEVVGLPQGCVGAATVQADPGGKVFATAAYLQGNVEQPTVGGGYNAFTPADGGRSIVMPLYRKSHTSAQLTTAYQIMNLGTAPAHVNVQPMTGYPDIDPLTIEPGAAASFYPPTVAALPAGRYGSAYIYSDQPIAVVAVDASLTGSMDMSIYRGIKADPPPTPPAGQPPAAPARQVAPLLLMNADINGPTRPTPDASVNLPAQPPHAAFRIFLP